MTKLQQHQMMLAAVRGSLCGSMTEDESSQIAKLMMEMPVDLFDSEELTTIYDAIAQTVSTHRPSLTPAQWREWRNFSDRLVYVIQKLNEPKGSPCRNIVLKPTRKRY